MKLIDYHGIHNTTPPVRIHIVESEDDLPAFCTFVNCHPNGLGFDTETTGLDWWSEDFRIRLAQFGNAHESFILPVERGGVFQETAVQAVERLPKLAMQNGTFDILCMDRCWNVPAETVFPKLVDSRIIAHLVDSRGRKDGGFGHSLEDLTRHYISQHVADEVKASMAVIARALKVLKADVWREVPLDHEGFLLYAGMDPILSYRLVKILTTRLPPTAKRLVAYEHRLAEVCAYMARTGIKIDVPYIKEQSARLSEDEDRFKAIASEFGLDNINSPKQVGIAILARGITPTHQTPTGQPKVDDKLLQAHLDDPLCEAVYRGKRAAKVRATWFENALKNRDTDKRLHPSINTLGARTGRMSVGGAIPAQTFPSGDSYVRRGFLADFGMLVCTVDYKTQELRVLAALSGDRNMKRAFREGADLHQITADASSISRKVGKMTNFLTVYGGGPAALMEQAGVSRETAEKAIRGFFEAFPDVARYAAELQREALHNGYITTNTGRRLYVDRKRSYSALNYAVQSASRDVTGRAILRLHKQGYGKYMLIPVHDEIVFQFPEKHAYKAAAKAADIMKETLNGVLIDTEWSVYGKSWGCGYLAEGEHCTLCNTIHKEAGND